MEALALGLALIKVFQIGTALAAAYLCVTKIGPACIELGRIKARSNRVEKLDWIGVRQVVAILFTSH